MVLERANKYFNERLSWLTTTSIDAKDLSKIVNNIEMVQKLKYGEVTIRIVNGEIAEIDTLLKDREVAITKT